MQGSSVQIVCCHFLCYVRSSASLFYVRQQHLDKEKNFPRFIINLFFVWLDSSSIAQKSTHRNKAPPSSRKLIKQVNLLFISCRLFASVIFSSLSEYILGILGREQEAIALELTIGHGKLDQYNILFLSQLLWIGIGITFEIKIYQDLYKEFCLSLEFRIIKKQIKSVFNVTV